MIKLDIGKVQNIESPTAKDFLFLELSGRKYYHKQGYTGQGIVVAVVDTGVSPHPELDGRILPGKNFSTDWLYDPDIVTSADDHGHGTHVAGTIAGKTCGIAPRAKILPVKVLNKDGIVEDVNDIINGLEWIKTWRGPGGEKVSIVNMSLTCSSGYLNRYPEKRDRLHQAIKDLVAANILVVCAAGNTGRETIDYPASWQEPTVVGAVDIDRQAAYFTSWTHEVDVCQIGVNVLSAYYKGGYAMMSGTSMATPIVSGIAALIASKYKAIHGSDIPEPVLYEILKMHTIDIGAPGTDPVTGAGFCTLSPYPVRMEIRREWPEMLVNGEQVPLRQPAILMNGRTMVPVREPYEAAGATVVWDETVWPPRAIIQT